MDQDTEKRLDRIEAKLEAVYNLQLATAQQDMRISALEDSVKEIKNTRRQTQNMWLAPLISSLVSAIVALVISGGLK